MVVVRRLQQVARLVAEAEVRKHPVLGAGDGDETRRRRRRLIVDCREEDASTFVRFVRSEQEGRRIYCFTSHVLRLTRGSGGRLRFSPD